MKRSICILLIVLLLSSLLLISSIYVFASNVVGDSDNDGDITINDATLIQFRLANLIDDSKIDMAASDVDKDNDVTVLDVTHIQFFLAHISNLDGSPYGVSEDPLGGEDNIRLLVWTPEYTVEQTRKTCQKFTNLYPDKNMTIIVRGISQSDAAMELLNDPSSSADVLNIGCDQIGILCEAGALAPVTNRYIRSVSTRNVGFAVNAAAYNGKMYAYPMTCDNGYYLLYDKSFVSDNDAKTLEGVLAACRKARKKFVLDTGNGYYACMFPFTGGMKTEGMKNGVQQFNNYNEDDVVDTLLAFSNLLNEYSDVIESAAVSTITSGMASYPSTVAAGIDGSWNAGTARSLLGQNYGAAKLPTVSVNGTAKQIIPMQGGLMLGVSSISSYPDTAQALADYLSDEKAQIQCVKEFSWGPSNKAAAKDNSVTSNPALAAMLAQSEFAVPQTGTSVFFWDPMENLGNEIYFTKYFTRESMRRLLRKTVANIQYTW